MKHWKFPRGDFSVPPSHSPISIYWPSGVVTASRPESDATFKFFSTLNFLSASDISILYFSRILLSAKRDMQVYITSKPSGSWAKLFVIHNIVTVFVIHNVIHNTTLWLFVILNSLKKVTVSFITVNCDLFVVHNPFQLHLFADSKILEKYNIDMWDADKNLMYKQI